MASQKEQYINRYVIQIERPGHGWEIYRLIAKPEDLKQLIDELSIAIEKFEGNKKPTIDNANEMTRLWKGYATRAFERTDRIQFEVLASPDLAPFHRPSVRRRLTNYSQVPLAIILGTSVVVGIATIAYFIWQLVLWLQAAAARL
jgi:hypothetical protein